jgi:hypothetical protein
LPVLTLFPGLRLGDDLLLQRYLGRRDLSKQILAAADSAGGLPVVADKRDVLADLFHALGARPVPVFAVPPLAKPAHYYEQMHALPSDRTGPVLLVTAIPPACAGKPVKTFDLSGGAYARDALAAYVVDAGCLHARP